MSIGPPSGGSRSCAGPAAAFYGSGSSGGIINILTRDGGPDPVSGRAPALVRGAFGLKKGFAEMGGTTGIMNYSLTGSMLSGDGYRDWSAYKGDNARGKFAFAVSPKVKVTAVLGWTDFYNQNPEGLNLDWFSADPKVLRRQANPDSASKNEFQKTQRGTGGVTSIHRPRREPGPDRDRLLPEHQVCRSRPFDGHPSRPRHAGPDDAAQPPDGLGPVHEPPECRRGLRLAGHRRDEIPQPRRRRRRSGSRRRPDPDPDRRRRLRPRPARDRPPLGRLRERPLRPGHQQARRPSPGRRHRPLRRRRLQAGDGPARRHLEPGRRLRPLRQLGHGLSPPGNGGARQQPLRPRRLQHPARRRDLERRGGRGPGSDRPVPELRRRAVLSRYRRTISAGTGSRRGRSRPSTATSARPIATASRRPWPGFLSSRWP